MAVFTSKFINLEKKVKVIRSSEIAGNGNTTLVPYFLVYFEGLRKSIYSE